MTAGDGYRIKAVELLARANSETDPHLRIEFESLANSFLRLAEQAERNSHVDIVYETPPAKDAKVKR